MSTITEFYMTMSNDFHEARFVITDFLSSKASTLASYASQHTPELLYGSLTVSLLVMACSFAFMWMKSKNKAERLSDRVDIVKDSRDWWIDRCAEARGATGELARKRWGVELSMANRIEELESELETTATHRDELFSETESLTADRDSFEEERDDFEAQLDAMRNDLEEVEETVEDQEDTISFLRNHVTTTNARNRELSRNNCELSDLVLNYKELNAMNDEAAKAA